MFAKRIDRPRASLRRSCCRLGAALVLCGLAFSSTDAAAGGKRCKGTKQFFQGKCRYPDEIARIRAAAQQRQQAEADARRKAEEQKAEEERRAKDGKACIEARRVGTLDSWQSYLDEYQNGMCQQEALDTIEKLESAATIAVPLPDQPPPPPPKPEPEPEEPDDGLWLGLHPVAWIGFGLTAAGAITWGVAGGISLSRTSELETTCPNNTCPPDREGDLDDANVAAHATTVGVVVTGVGAALALTGLLIPLSAGDDDAAAAGRGAPRLNAVMGLGSAGLRGWF